MFNDYQIRFIDNTDPAGIDHQIAQLGSELASTLVIGVSKVRIEKKYISSLSSLIAATRGHQKF